jgi:ferredoxin
MSYIIGKACIGVKDGACIEVCPVDCIHEGEESMYIDPEECIDCGICLQECPVEAIYDSEEDAIEAGELEAVQNNYKYFKLDFKI